MVLILMIESKVEMINRLPHVVLVVPKNEKIVSVDALAISDQSKARFTVGPNQYFGDIAI